MEIETEMYSIIVGKGEKMVFRPISSQFSQTIEGGLGEVEDKTGEG
jgi:hypothetical protein